MSTPAPGRLARPTAKQWGRERRRRRQRQRQKPYAIRLRAPWPFLSHDGRKTPSAWSKFTKRSPACRPTATSRMTGSPRSDSGDQESGRVGCWVMGQRHLTVSPVAAGTADPEAAQTQCSINHPGCRPMPSFSPTQAPSIQAPGHPGMRLAPTINPSRARPLSRPYPTSLILSRSTP
jgi:hypothetical protein